MVSGGSSARPTYEGSRRDAGPLLVVTRRRKIVLPIMGDVMLRFMDWSLVAMGCALVLASLGSWWWERTKVRKGGSPDQGVRFISAWLPLLMGLGMIGAKVPSQLLAPHPVVMIVDTFNVVLSVTVLVLALRAGRRLFRAGGPRTLE